MIRLALIWEKKQLALLINNEGIHMLDHFIYIFLKRYALDSISNYQNVGSTLLSFSNHLQEATSIRLGLLHPICHVRVHAMPCC
jgi:hypothetical protein